MINRGETVSICSIGMALHSLSNSSENVDRVTSGGGAPVGYGCCSRAVIW